MDGKITSFPATGPGLIAKQVMSQSKLYLVLTRSISFVNKEEKVDGKQVIWTLIGL